MIIKKHDIIEDLSLVTTIPIQTLQKIDKKKQQCIAHQVLENYLNKEYITCITTDIGDIYFNIDLDSGELTYKYIPEPKFEKILVDAINNNESPLITEVDNSLYQKVTSTYKDLF